MASEKKKSIGHTCKEDRILNENDERKKMGLQDFFTSIGGFFHLFAERIFAIIIIRGTIITE